MDTLNFKEKKVQVISLDDLERTYHENLYDGTPVGGIYHFALIQQVLEICEKHGMKPEVQEIFAADNRDSKRPGVSVLPAVEANFGEGAIQAHLLRRVYANIALRIDETEEFVTNLCVAYHQRGIQLAVGPQVKICHNQCIMHPSDVVSNYGDERVDIDGLLLKVERWMNSYAKLSQIWQSCVEKMQDYAFGQVDGWQLVGMLVDERVRHDSRLKQERRPDCYPLNNTQINRMAELMFVRRQEMNVYEEPPRTLWDAYNLCTAELHPDKTDIPAVIPQQLALIQCMKRMLRNKQ